MRLSRTSGAATTNSASMQTRNDSSRRPSPNSPPPSDHSSTQACHVRIPSTQQRLGAHVQFNKLVLQLFTAVGADAGLVDCCYCARRSSNYHPKRPPQTAQVLSSALSFIHSRTSVKFDSFPMLSSSCHHTSSKLCSMANLTVRNTVHDGRRRQNFHFHLGQQSLHWPRLLTWC